MTWTALYLPVADTALTAAQVKTYIFDNLNETAVAKATVAGSYFAGTGANAVAERTFQEGTFTGSQTTTSETFVALGGPHVFVTTSGKAVVHVNSRTQSATSGKSAICSYEVDVGGGVNGRAVWGNSLMTRSGITDFVPITPGFRQFGLCYRTTDNTSTAEFWDSHICVMPL